MSVPRWFGAAATAALMAVGCGDDSSSGDADTQSSTGEEPTTTGTTLATNTQSTSDQTSTTASTATDPTTTSEESTGSSSGSSTGFDPPVEECGNGFVEGDEECDDANDNNEDACNNGCRFRCGLQWSAIGVAPTGTSTLDPRGIAVDQNQNVIVVSFQREISTDAKGNQTVEPDDVLVAKYDAAGREQWSVRVGQADDDVSIADVAVDAAGDIYLAATVRPVGLSRDIWGYKLSGADGTTLWTHSFDSAVDDATDAATGVAIGSGGNPVLVGQIRAGDGDDDIFARAIDAATGDEIWTSTWSGVGNGVFSTDNAGRAVAGSDGTIYVFGQEYVNFQSLLGVVVAFPAGGGVPLWTHSVTAQGGGTTYDPISIGIDDGGDLLLAFRRISGATNDFFLQKLASSDQAELYTLNVTDLQSDTGDDWSIAGAAGAGEGAVVVGTLEATNGDAFWRETWVSQLDSAGSSVCQIVQPGPTQGLIPASLSARATTAASDGGPVVAAQLVEDQDQAVFVGRFAVD